MNNNRQVSLFILFALIIFLLGCAPDQRIKESTLSMYSSTVRIIQDSMLCINGSDSSDIINHCSLRLVVYVDSSECSACYIDQLEEWSYFLRKYDDIKELSFIVLLELESSRIESTKEKLRVTGIHTPVFIDTLSVFRRANPQIPNNKIFHTFLLNESDSVLLVGNPLQNDRIDKLFRRVLDKHKKKNNNRNKR